MEIQFLLVSVLAFTVAAMLRQRHWSARAMRMALHLVAGMSLAVGVIGGAS